MIKYKDKYLLILINLFLFLFFDLVDSLLFKCTKNFLGDKEDYLCCKFKYNITSPPYKMNHL